MPCMYSCDHLAFPCGSWPGPRSLCIGSREGKKMRSMIEELYSSCWLDFIAST